MSDKLNELALQILLKSINNDETDKKSESNNSFWQIGQKYLVRTVTMYCLGELKDINSKELIFKTASWVADCGRFNNALKTGQLLEVEPFVDDVCVSREALIDATRWRFDLPVEVKE